jgi:hypothetical protein
VRPSLVGAVVGVPAAALLGAAAGAVGTIAHSVVLDTVVDLPVGLLLAVALTVAVHAGVMAAWPTRPAALAAVLGWGLAVFAGVATGPGGDFLIARPPGPVDTAWLVLGPAALLVSTVVVRRTVLDPRRRPASA